MLLEANELQLVRCHLGHGIMGGCVFLMLFYVFQIVDRGTVLFLLSEKRVNLKK